MFFWFDGFNKRSLYAEQRPQQRIRPLFTSTRTFFFFFLTTKKRFVGFYAISFIYIFFFLCVWSYYITAYRSGAFSRKLFLPSCESETAFESNSRELLLAPAIVNVARTTNVYGGLFLIPLRPPLKCKIVCIRKPPENPTTVFFGVFRWKIVSSAKRRTVRFRTWKLEFFEKKKTKFYDQTARVVIFLLNFLLNNPYQPNVCPTNHMI